MLMRAREQKKVEDGEPHGSSSSSPAQTSGGGRDAMELLNYHWFFHNILSSGTKIASKSPTCYNSGGSGGGDSDAISMLVEECNSTLCKPPKPPEHHQSRRDLPHRQPSLPPDIGRPLPDHREQDVAMVSPSKLIHPKKKKKKLHRSYTSLEAKSSTRQRHNGYYESNDCNHRYKNNNRVRDDIKARKWKSMSDLEHEEVQGFQDLGFVFGDGNELSPLLLKMIPGLRDREAKGGGEVRRPYLSEAWMEPRSAPPMLNWDGLRPAMDMKENLRFWAKVVASSMCQQY